MQAATGETDLRNLAGQPQRHLLSARLLGDVVGQPVPDRIVNVYAPVFRKKGNASFLTGWGPRLWMHTRLKPTCQ